MGVTAQRHRLTGWTPIDVTWSDQPQIRWCFTEGIPFTSPFFDQTIEECLRDPFRLLFWRETGIEALADFARSAPGLEPAGLVLHGSRCGSTLITQMFAGLAATLVVSEPGPVDALLRAPVADTGDALADRADCLRWMVSALGQPRGLLQTRLVVKLDAWAILALPLIRRAFPDTPLLFAYRDPRQVIASHLGRRGYHMIPGTLPAEALGMALGDHKSMSPEQYCAAVLGKLYEAALGAARDSNLHLVNYDALPGAVPDRIAPLFGVEVGDPERSVFAAAAARDAKNPAVPFLPDSAAKRRGATDAVTAAAGALVQGAYEALETIRVARS
jgi:hypothetical protein